MYVALKEMLEAKPNGAIKRIFPGELVETFASWPVQNQVAAISARLVREAPEAPEHIAHTLAGAASPTEVREAKERAFQAAVADAKPALQPSVVAPSPVTAPAAAAKADDFACMACSFTSHSARGLAIHMSKEHKTA